MHRITLEVRQAPALTPARGRTGPDIERIIQISAEHRIHYPKV